MPRMTYTVEVKVDVANDEQHLAMIEITKQFARDMMSAAALFDKKGQPTSVARTEDAFFDSTEIELLAPTPT